MRVEAYEARIDFKAVEAINQEMLLGQDFCIKFGLETNLWKGTWQVNEEGPWYQFKGEKVEEPEETIEGTIVARKRGEREEETIAEGVREWICTVEWLGEEEEVEGEAQVSLCRWMNGVECRVRYK